MLNQLRFNYIITIHNKEELIKDVIMSILVCCRENSHIYPVIDGCTDRTEAIIDDIINTFAHVPIKKVYTPDVHEILSINAGLRAANQEGDGYNIILQDDVMLHDFFLEEKVSRLYEWAGSSLGFVSFRHGANLTIDAANSNELYPFADHVENAYGHGLPQTSVLLPGHFAYRTIAIKSPVCIPFSLVRSVGMLEERLQPYMCDDIEYSIRCIKAGYRNGVFALRFQSDVEWGSTRTKPSARLHELEKRNIGLIKEWHGSTIANISSVTQVPDIVEVPNMVSQDDKTLALKTWERNQNQLEAFFNSQGKTSFFDRIKSRVKNGFRKLFSHQMLKH